MSEAARARPETAARRWALPAIESDAIIGMRREPDREPTPQERARTLAAEMALARAQAQAEAERAQQEARERGYQDGLRAAQDELQPKLARIDERLRQLDEALTRLARPLEDLDAEVSQQLARLAVAVGRQLARRELSADPGQVIALIREAVGRLPAAAREVRVHLNPRDATAVRERLASPVQERAWTLVEDPTLDSGGCLVRSDTSQVDARLESRLNAIAAELFGEPRARDRAAGGDPAATAATGADAPLAEPA